jgi:hypothetical protein
VIILVISLQIKKVQLLQASKHRFVFLALFSQPNQTVFPSLILPEKTKGRKVRKKAGCLFFRIAFIYKEMINR